MAIPHNQAIMVLRQEGTTTSTVPQTSACSLFVVVNQLHPGGGRQDKQTLFASTEASTLAKPNIGSCVASFNKVSSMSLSAMATTNTSNQLCNLPAESTCKGITVTLDNNNMWNEFFRCQTEMILTKQGRRMFPCCRFRISGLEPFQRYTLVMDMQPVDNYRYKWSDRRWETNGKADPHIFRSFVHPDSPATGLDWMQYPVSFYKLKLTNNPLDREGHIIINSMHRYIPRLHIIPADKAVDLVQLDGPDVVTFSFSQTEFFAVTAYQNLSITQLKIDYNPFAKGFRDDANNSRCCKPKSAPSTEKLENEVKSSKEATALNNLKSLFAKMNASEKVTTNGDLKTVHCDAPKRVEPGSSSTSMKRPWPGGLSELIKGAHVKVKRISLEKIRNGSSQQMDIDSLASKGNNMDVASKDCTSENISIPDVTKEGKETVSFSKHTDSSTLKNTTESFSAANIQCKLNKTTSNTPLNEKVATILSETATLTDEKLSIEETSQSVVKPLDCGGEVKKKRAEPVPLPLLALFLQQLKSKTRPTRPKPKSEACSLPSQSDKSCHDTSVAENLSSSTASFTPSLNTQLTVQPAASPASQTITSSILTCTVASTEHETVSTPNSAADAVTGSTASVVRDTLQLSTPEKVSATTSAFAHNVKPNTSLSDTTPDTKIVSVTLDDASSDRVLSCDPKAFPATTPDAPNNELVHSNVSTDKSITEPAHDSCTVPCPVPVPEVVPRSPSPGVKTPSSPSCAPSSPYMSAPSSPDPFPPSMFSDRPIPPRKTLDPFPPCLSLDRLRPLLEQADPLPQRFFTIPTPPGDPGPAVFGVTSEVNCPVVSPDPSIPKELKQSLKTIKGKKCKVKQKKGGKSKLSEDTEVMEGPIPVPMQPNLEDVEGQLFVSFMSKKALEIHLGDEAKEEILQKTTENIEGEVHDEKESIDALEKVLLRDLKNMKYRQVIHPVLQAVGLKLNLLDVTLSIDLQYLGVCLPIPPPILLPEGNSGTCSSQVHFVSRTGKTTDITKIKGWREKFSTTSPSSVSGVTTSSDTGQKNLSAFCSDMLDEYLESEGKLIDERAASFSQALVTPVAYQLPTKSTSYVRTLDSVLKKQALPLATALSEPSAKSRKTALTSKSKEAVSRVKMKKSNKSSAKNPVSSTDKKSEGSSSKKSTKSNTSKSVSNVPSTAPGLSQSKTSPKIKTKKRTKTSQDSLQTAEKSVKGRVSVAPVGQNASSTPGSNVPVGRSSGLPKTLVKLRDVEDGAVWEGKHRTFITMERAAIALSCLVTAEGTIGGSPSTVIKRRAPPCLNDFCRLGCVCASLVQMRRQHHCGKPQCMLGCDCLRRKVVLLKNEDTDEGSAPLNHAEENGTKVKKKKNRISYILSGADATPEPALHVKTLWIQQNDSDSEPVYIPDPARPLHPQPVSQDLQKDSENFLHPSSKRAAVRAVDGEGSSRVKNQESLDCARVRPFCGRKLSPCRQRHMKEGHPDLSSQDSLQEIEEGELRPPTQSGPTKRLEIVSKCKWATEGSRNVVLRTVCERMAQDRLKHPFWIGKYQIQPTSKTIKETDEGSIITYKVVISQPHLEESEKKKEERIKQLEAQLIETIGKSEVKGLPLLSKVTPAGLLKAEKKPSGALGQIMVNGKLYPQAKLELGQMGALHPANRLAAYITGRVCVANKHDPKAVTTTTKTSQTAPTTPTSVATTTVTTTLSSTVTVDKPTVAKHPMETEVVKVEVNCVNSQQQKTASTSTLPVQTTVKNLIIPSSSMLTGSPGISVSPNMLPKASIASHASLASGTTDGSIQVVKAVPGSGSTASEKTFVLSTTGSNVALSGSGIRLMQPLTSTRPAVPGQRMMMFKAANPAGRVIHLVPLGQFRALNPNVLIRPQQSTLIRLPTPSPVPLSKPQTYTTVTSATAPSSATQVQNMTPVHSTTTESVTTSSTSPVATKSFTPLSGSKTLLLCNKPCTVKIIPGFLRDPATSTLRILPQRVFEEAKTVKGPRITSSASSAQSSSEGHPANQGLQLTSQSCLTTKNQDPQKLDKPIHTDPTPAKEFCEEDSQCSKISPENVIFTDHSYTFEMKKTITPSKKPTDVSKDSSDHANGSTYHMLLKEVLDLGLVEEAEGCGTSGAVLGTESGDESKAGSHLVEEEVDSDCTELTEDSDLYNDTDSSQSNDKEDLCVVTEYEGEEKNKEKQDLDLTEKDDDELVDIETFEEGAEKSLAPPEQTQHESFQNHSSDEENENENLFKLRKRKDEKKRRITLRNCFYNLQQTLNIEDPKVPKITLLSEALEEIHSLTKRRDRLVKMRDKLRKKRAYYIEMASQLSGKNKESISQELDEIIAKQKSLEIEDKADDTSLNLKKVPKHSQRNINTKQKKVGTSGKAEHLRISRHKYLGFQDRRTENVSTNQKMTATKTGQPAKPPNSHPVPQLRKCPPIPVPRERTRPNILSRNKPQTLAKDQVLVPQVIPMVEAVVPCSQIITISKPLQPTDITPLGQRQSTTPGVAAVSISIPPTSHPLCVENPLPILQPQVLKLASSPVNTPVHNISLPKISSVVSLVQSEKLLMQTQAACNSSAGEAQQNPSSDETTLVEEEKHLDKQLPEVVPKKPEHDVKFKIDEDPKKQKEDEKNTPKLEQDDNRLMSLLDELVFLNQTSEPQEAAPSLTEAGDVLTELLTNKEADMDRDDERSLSPLFLKLDEDLITSPTSKDEEIDDIPPKVDDLVKVIFGSESPPNSSESETVATVSDDGTRVSVCHVKHDAPTPPPLLQMKTGGCTTADSPKEQANLPWRPMPKLAPLGLKTQETGHPKLISPHAHKSDSKLPSLHNTHV
ncbi:MAX dimerization protein MGA a [Pangasianodon hypophthalmus]|uniref:MAX dimerization protein MGA a n=1 Tax=Pangasianodon hypophthalmus TaxID=310915 RepID=UPI000EFF0358|nr:MAX dimerization protein MGA a [Pangasianodon hypophthalmus]